MTYITPNDPGIQAESDARSIQNAIAAVPPGPGRVVRIPRVNARTGAPLWVIDETILLPSGITLLLDDCHLRLADGMIGNMFRNENMYTPQSLTPQGEQRDIHLVGRGGAVLDGGTHNGLTEATMMQNGLPNVRNNNLVLLHNVRGYSLEGLTFRDPRYWAVNQLFCHGGRLSNLRFEIEHLVRNQDGIDLRVGCSDIVIEHVSGRTGDDVVALTALPLSDDGELLVEGQDMDIHDIVIRDVRANTRCTLAALRSSDGACIHHVRIEDIHDTGAPWTPWGVVRLGENNYFERSPGTMREIEVCGIHSRHRGSVFLAGTLDDVRISGVYAEGDAMSCVSTYYPDAGYDEETRCRLAGGATLRNVLIEDLRYDACAPAEDIGYMSNPDLPCVGCALDLRCMRPGEDRLENVVVRNVSARNAEALLIHPEYRLEIRPSGDDFGSP